MSNSSAVCMTAACQRAATEYLQNLAPNYKQLDPCTNFEEMTCGGWRLHHDLRADQGVTQTLSIMGDEAMNISRSILEGSYPGTNASALRSRHIPVEIYVRASTDEDNFNMMKEAYNTCLDETSIAQAGTTPLVQVLDDLAATFNGSDWSDSITYLRKLGFGAFVNLYVGEDDKDPETQAIFMMPRSGVSLDSADIYNDTEAMTRYQDAMEKVLTKIHPSGTCNNTAARAAAVVKFEQQIAAITPPLSDLSNVEVSYNKVALKDAAALIPQLGLEHVLQSLAPSNYTPDTIIAGFPNFLTQFSSIISSTSKDVIKTYLVWRTVQELSSAIISDDIKPYLQFQNWLSGKDLNAKSDRWRTCINHVDDGLGWILSKFWVEQNFPGASQDAGNQIIKDIRSVYITRLRGIDWMEDSVKETAIQKVNNIIQKVGFSTENPNAIDPESLKQYYAGIKLTGTFFGDFLSILRDGTVKEWAKLGKPTDKNTFLMTSPTVNAYYNPPLNQIVFPAGILQFPIFDVELPGYINYGAFGAVAGHELSHAFDNNGRVYDQDGHYRDWWTNATFQQFETRAQCFISEFNNYTVNGTVNGADAVMHINGANTLGENIADSGGSSASWAAWNEARKTKPDQGLPGMEGFTQEQLFYIAYANVWCGKYTRGAMAARVRSDVHSPGPIRILGTTANSRGFREAFNCPVKEPTCELW